MEPTIITRSELIAAAAPAQKKSAGLSSEEVKRWKLKFMDVARAVCPAFEVAPENRAAINEIFHWAMCTRQGALDPERGLFLWGNIGTGKSTLLAVIEQFCKLTRPRNAQGFLYAFRTTSAIDVAEAFNAEGYAGVQTYCDSPQQAFDDLGTEPLHVNYYGTRVNVMEHVLLARYNRRRESFTHITTNIEPADVADLYGQRVYDRCREMFNFVELAGQSHRAELQRGAEC